MTDSPAPVSPTPRLPARRTLAIALAPVVILVYFALAPKWILPIVTATPKPVATPEITGAGVYQQNCAYCHGVNGDGRGSMILQPPARYFGRDKFKFATNAAAMPSDDDLRGILKRGIPGSAMPNFAHLSDTEVTLLIEYLRGLIRKGLYERQDEAEREKAKKNDDDPIIKPDLFAKNAVALSVPGEPLALPATIPPSTAEAIDRGKTLFLSEAWGCSKCHGPAGKGDGPQTKDPNFKNDDKTPAVPRDLTQGVFKGGSDPAQIYARIRLGIPGTPMPDSKDKPEKDVWDVVHYVRSLSPKLTTAAPPFTNLHLAPRD